MLPVDPSLPISLVSHILVWFLAFIKSELLIAVAAKVNGNVSSVDSFGSIFILVGKVKKIVVVEMQALLLGDPVPYQRLPQLRLWLIFGYNYAIDGLYRRIGLISKLTFRCYSFLKLSRLTQVVIRSYFSGVK